MGQVFSKIASVFLAIVVLFSTMSFTIDKHYCGKTLVDVAINKKAKTCGMEMIVPAESASVSQKSCCQNEHLVMVGQDELKKQFEVSIDFDTVYTLQKATPFQLGFVQASITPNPIGNHDPPDRDFDFQVLFQTYLI